ncbi:MAG: Penicillin-binding protein [Candidatus Amesbacteria bacterium GW2011_GWB1_47_19]|nr:MAG: Penicillin-binding protein, 1A family [Candidatus Amesbacteria bacterium GW2011_GWC1_46_24]KKU66789.1 MAG: Penicillin-binding protein [Candidatus Amesbacteria bacterium GW2011_GWB1_47_19]HBC73152.1 penicillin-binding protein [Candidatus Amesbacteria bacterium]
MLSLKSFLKFLFPYVRLLSLLSFRRLRLFLILLILFSAGLFSLFYIFILRGLPSPSSLSRAPLPLTTHIRDRNGVELYKIYSGQNRTLVKLDDLSPHIKQAILAIEDKDFYYHSGFSLQAIFRSVVKNLTLNNLKCALSRLSCSLSIQGGSTITQQLVKTALLSPERTLRRKLRELTLSIAVEHLYSKDQILEMYLNRVGFGGATYGIEEAAQTYFGKPSSALGLPEAAFLAGLPASPTSYSPFGAHPELALTRQQEVLRHMVSAGFISWEQAEASASAQLTLMPPRSDIKAPHFVMYIKDLLAQKYGSALVEQGGLDVITSLDLSLQEQAQNIVAQEVARITYLHIENGAALVTNPNTGEILAMVGSHDYFDFARDGQVNVTKSVRQPGSAIKPVNYALAFSRNFTPASPIDDSPITYRIPGQEPYSPVNYDRRFHGRISLRTALASSYNVPAVKLLAANGVSEMVSLGQKMGITTWNDPSRYGLSLTLGGGDVTMQDLAVVYGVLANNGRKVSLHPILSVRDSRGRLLEKFDYEPEPVLDPRIAFLISDILSDNAARTPTFGSRSQLNIPGQQVAVKTGTTNNLRDNWTIGFSPDRLVAVWVGNNDNTPMSYVASGVTGASPIWRSIMDLILADHPSAGFSPPDNLVKLQICPVTGQRACSACGGRWEYFLSGTEPKQTCTDISISGIKTPTPVPPDHRILTGVSVQISTPAPPSPPPQTPKEPPARKKPRKR